MLSAIWLFYRNFRVFTQAVGWGGWLMAGAPLGKDLWDMVAPLFWLKLASYGVIWYFMQQFSRPLYFFYQNLGYSVRWLFAGAFLLDMLLFFGVISIIQWSTLLF